MKEDGGKGEGRERDMRKEDTTWRQGGKEDEGRQGMIERKEEKKKGGKV